jgi:NitT/TauT family transport system substrate-binding protein
VILQPCNAAAQTLYVLNAAGFDAEADVSWPVVVAQERGFLAREGIQLKSVRTDKAVMGLLSGSFDVINGEIAAAMLAAEKGANIIATYVLCERPSQYLVLAKTVTHLRELEGKNVGVYQVPSMAQLLIKRHLQKSGVDINKINFLRTGGSRERLASLLAGQSSATTLSTSHVLRAQQEGLKIVTSPADWDRVAWNAIIFRKPWAEANSNVVVKYLRAVRQATAWLYEPSNFNEALRILTPLSGLDENTMRWALKSSLDNKIFNLNRPALESVLEAFQRSLRS